MDKDDKYICVRCLTPIHGDEVELVGLVIYCPGCAKAFRDDAEIQALLDNAGVSCC